MENVAYLAKYLLSDQEEFTSEEIDKIIEKGNTRRIYLDQKVNVHIYYWTAWRENGKTRFTDDIYNYEETTYKALKKLLKPESSLNFLHRFYRQNKYTIPICF